MGGRSLNAVQDAYTYLDHAATTPMRPDAVSAMLPFLTEQFANPSGSHRFARQVRQSIDEARDDVADVLGCRPGEVIFTSGGLTVSLQSSSSEGTTINSRAPSDSATPRCAT